MFKRIAVLQLSQHLIHKSIICVTQSLMSKRKIIFNYNVQISSMLPFATLSSRKNPLFFLFRITKRHFDNNNFCFAHCSYCSCVLIRQYHLKWKKSHFRLSRGDSLTGRSKDWKPGIRIKRSKLFQKKNEVIKCIWKNVRELEKPLGGHYLRFFL